jgi:hypothetical protein
MAASSAWQQAASAAYGIIWRWRWHNGGSISGGVIIALAYLAWQPPYGNSVR